MSQETNRKVMLDPAARLGVQVKAGPWISSPIKAIAAADTLVCAQSYHEKGTNR